MAQACASLQIRGLTHRIDRFDVLNDLHLDFPGGEIHGILGQNGTGKTTLLNLLSGVHPVKTGEILLNGRRLKLHSPHDALLLGIRLSVQGETFLKGLTVAENMRFSEYGVRTGKWILNRRRIEREMQAVLDDLGLPLRADGPVSSLNYGEQQMLKIACMLVGKAPRVLLIDEPYRACSFRDIEGMYAIFRKLRDRGVTVIFTTHRVEDATAVCDTLTVLHRNGTADQRRRAGMDLEGVVSLVTENAFRKITYPRLQSRPGSTLLSFEGVSTRRIDDVSFSLKKGEILGIAGLLGSGRTGIARALAGQDPVESGTIRLAHREIGGDAQSGVREGLIGALLCNRRDMLLADMDIPENITVGNLKGGSGKHIIRIGEERLVGFDYCRQFNIDPRHLYDPAGRLSAGNQQKLLLARLFYSNCRILILDEPTMNIDIVSRNEIYNLMNQHICRGNSIILISSDLNELAGMSHRILVMKGRTVEKEIKPEELSYQTLLAGRQEGGQ
ncbi:MAG: sugar ABC transporter ATP-binding protein [Clostridiales bacterium]|nr:sugar ABC transporter ATP-binding protein [Clostridiales bacterium]